MHEPLAPLPKRLRRKSVSFNAGTHPLLKKQQQEPTPVDLVPPSVAYAGLVPVDLVGGSDASASGSGSSSTNSWANCHAEPLTHSAAGKASYEDEIDEQVEEQEVGNPILDEDSGAEVEDSGSFADWKLGPRYTVVRLLGSGSYGEVAEALDNQNGGRVAIKRIVNVFDQEVDARRIYREMHILRKLNSKEVMHLLDVPAPKDYANFKDLYLVCEFVDTDLYKLILSPQYLSNAHIQTFLYQILVGLKHIHAAHVIHRDIKPANILLNEDCTVKICDFGLSRVVRLLLPLRLIPSHSLLISCLPLPRLGLPPMLDQPAPTPTAPARLLFLTSSSSDEGEQERAPKKLRRQLTKHVVTRWYRAPELILLQDYTNAVDVWSLGCILAELLSMQRESVPKYQDRLPLFPGKSCFPLSADMPTTYADKLDQLNVIFGVIGTPPEEDVAALGEVRQYLEKLKPKQPRDLRQLYPGADQSALELLQGMLQFNPSKRITVEEALNSKYLSSVRRPSCETITDKVRVS
ncbi:unnamed protein product [Chrysoparadoxa australica]